MYSLVLDQVLADRERFAAHFAHMVLFAGVYSHVQLQMVRGTQQFVAIGALVFQTQMRLDVSPVATDAPERFAARFTLIADRLGGRGVDFHVAVQIRLGRTQFTAAIALVRFGAVIFYLVCGQFVLVEKTRLARVAKNAVHFFMPVLVVLHSAFVRRTVVARVARVRDARMFFFFVLLACAHRVKSFIATIAFVRRMRMCIVFMVLQRALGVKRIATFCTFEQFDFQLARRLGPVRWFLIVDFVNSVQNT